MFELPAQEFFVPTQAYWDFLKRTPWLRWKRFWDVGAGMGHLTDAMVAANYDCTGLDKNSREGQSYFVKYEDATERDYNPDDCLLIARPCHGNWLDKIFDYNAGTIDILYLGLDRNVDNDLANVYHETLAENVGEDGEKLIRVTGHRDHSTKWCLIKPDFWNHPSWMQDDGSWYRNSAGGGFPKRTLDVEVFETKYIGSPAMLRDTKENMCSKREGLNNGWIAPDGIWYPGESNVHADILKYVLGITEARAEEVGFVRCYGDPKAFWTKRGQALNWKQAKVLKEIGLTVDDYEAERSVE